MNVKAAVGGQGDALRPWTEAEETYLANAAGILSLENLGRALGRTEASVEEAAGRSGSTCGATGLPSYGAIIAPRGEPA